MRIEMGPSVERAVPDSIERGRRLSAQFLELNS